MTDWVILFNFNRWLKIVLVFYFCLRLVLLRLLPRPTRPLARIPCLCKSNHARSFHYALNTLQFGRHSKTTRFIRRLMSSIICEVTELNDNFIALKRFIVTAGHDLVSALVWAGSPQHQCAVTNRNMFFTHWRTTSVNKVVKANWINIAIFRNLLHLIKTLLMVFMMMKFRENYLRLSSWTGHLLYLFMLLCLFLQEASGN